MSANRIPIFGKDGDIESVLITAANTSSQGGGTIGTDIFRAYLADATNGSYVDQLIIEATATAPTATTATVLRIFISSQSAGAVTSANCWLIKEITLTIQNADNAAAQVNEILYALGKVLPAGYTILVSCHAAPAANTAWRVTVLANNL